MNVYNNNNKIIMKTMICLNFRLRNGKIHIIMIIGMCGEEIYACGQISFIIFIIVCHHMCIYLTFEFKILANNNAFGDHYYLKIFEVQIEHCLFLYLYFCI